MAPVGGQPRPGDRRHRRLLERLVGVPRGAHVRDETERVDDRLRIGRPLVGSLLQTGRDESVEVIGQLAVPTLEGRHGFA